MTTQTTVNNSEQRASKNLSDFFVILNSESSQDINKSHIHICFQRGLLLKFPQKKYAEEYDITYDQLFKLHLRLNFSYRNTKMQ